MDTVNCIQCKKPFTQEDPLQTACSRRCVRLFVIRWSGRPPQGEPCIVSATQPHDVTCWRCAPEAK